MLALLVEKSSAKRTTIGVLTEVDRFAAYIFIWPNLKGKASSANAAWCTVWQDGERFDLAPFFYFTPHLEFRLGRANAVSARIHRMIMLGHSSIDDDDEELGDDDAQGLKRRGPRWRRSNSMQAPKCLVLVPF